MAATSRFDPDAVATASFSAARRGYDTDEVRTYLKSLAGEVARLRAECDELRADLDARPREDAPLDEAMVARALGDEAARLLTTAREAAAQIRARSEDAATTLVDEANRDALRIREQADVDVALERRQAQEQAVAEIEGAKAEGRDMVGEARAVRERMMADVQRRREQAKAQLEQLRLGHERVLGTFELAADALGAVMADLRALAPDVRRNSAVDTGPVPLVLPARREADDIVDDVGPSVATEPVTPSPVQISVPFRPMPSRGDDTSVAVEATEPAAVDDGAQDDRSAGLVRSFALGEVAEEPAVDAEVQPAAEAALDTAAASASEDVEPLSDEEPVEVVALADTEVAVHEPVAVDEPDAVEASDGPHGAAEATAATIDDDASAAHEPDEHARPSADDLFARIRAARTAVTHAVLQPSGEAGTAAEPDQEFERARAAVLVAPAPEVEVGVDVIAERAIALAPVEAALARRLKRTLADEQNEVLDRLRRKNPVLTLDGLLGPLDEHAGGYQRAVRDEVMPAIVAGARSLRPELGDDEAVRLVGSRVAETAAGDVGAELVDPLRERMARILEHAGDSGAVTDGVRTLYRELKTQKLDALARHLALAAHGRAAYAVLVPGTPVCWAVDPMQPCADGEDNALGGPTPAGEPFPTGHLSAPAYVGCRCALAPAAR